jgi:hypothetical protein
MSLDLSRLTPVDIGRGVVYQSHATSPREDGVITSYNDRFVFVRYRGSETSKATSACDLTWLREKA